MNYRHCEGHLVISYSRERKLPAEPIDRSSLNSFISQTKVLKATRSTMTIKPFKSTRLNTTEIKAPTFTAPQAIPPLREHSSTYHYSLLFNDKAACDALLQWFEGVESMRSMPWRKEWIDPSKFEGTNEELQKLLAKRAYEVWVSEVMLQQTRVSTVIPYFNKWISTWPTVQDLAGADHNDVLSVWKGLGYYSRATRLHEGAKMIMAKSSGSLCPIPTNAADLQQLPGIGRYTAGAISSITFGVAEPVLDGNVMRVLSRQLGLYVNPKEKKSSDLFWEQADKLIKHVSHDAGTSTSAIPGKWNQALMELGSTICTPRPRCNECPIRATCRVLSEGQMPSRMPRSSVSMMDIEDSCSFCEPLDFEDLATWPGEDECEDVTRMTKKRKIETKQTNTLSHYFTAGTANSNNPVEKDATVDTLSSENTGNRKPATPVTIAKSSLMYCSLFPKRSTKKKVVEEECLVCMVQLLLPDGNSSWLIEQRPAKADRATFRQFPQSTIAASQYTPSQRKTEAQKFVSSLDIGDMSKAHYVASFPPLVHTFTHLRLTMHTYQYRVWADKGMVQLPSCPAPRKWVDTKAMEQETLSTGMRKCWRLVSNSL
ncbi:DNA glycosylase [Pyrenochaeta sp. DS3sAY3a]|nr:DNA glycosylase [Pyrenochaeta sp. DS3sAY3a]